jgi:hypothetical protein
MSFGGLEQKDPNIKLSQTLGKEFKSKLYIDNTKLDGFIEFFKKQDCIAMCNECNYCEEWAKKAVILEKEESTRYVESLKNYIDDIVSSREFGITSTITKEKEKGNLIWDSETENLFSKLIELTPPQFQPLARVIISSLAEEKAKKRSSQQVENEDMIKAFLEGTPGPFQADMREGLKRYKLIDE